MKPKKTKAAPAAKGATVLRSQVDAHVGYNAGRFPTTAYGSKLQKLAAALPKIVTPAKGFLVTKGPKGLLINEVHYNPETGFYSRKSGERELIGNIKALSEVQDLGASIYSPDELVAKVLKHPNVKRYQHRQSGEEVEVALLNKNTDSYFVGVTLDSHGHLRVLNMEPAAKYNTKKVQWVLMREVSDGKLLSRLHNYGSHTAKAVLHGKAA